MRGLLQPRRGPALSVCEDERRDRSLICVVEEPADVIPIERTHEYRGLYHVLGGALSPIDGIDPDDLRIDELVAAGRGRRRRGGRPGDQSDHHRRGDRASTSPSCCAARSPITRLASGLPVGADLEHADEVTLGRALSGRRSLGG